MAVIFWVLFATAGLMLAPPLRPSMCPNNLIEEEVIREREMRPEEARRSLTRFVATIIIATLLEAVVITFKVARERIGDMIFPAVLTFSGVALIRRAWGLLTSKRCRRTLGAGRC